MGYDNLRKRLIVPGCSCNTMDRFRAPPIHGVGADCDSQHEKEIKSNFLLVSAILAAQQPGTLGYEQNTGDKAF